MIVTESCGKMGENGYGRGKMPCNVPSPTTSMTSCYLFGFHLQEEVVGDGTLQGIFPLPYPFSPILPQDSVTIIAPIDPTILFQTF
jgi:hypothetical protein